MTDVLSAPARNVGEWLSAHGVAILIILAVALLIHAFGGAFVGRLIRRAAALRHHRPSDADLKREDTLIRIIRGTLRIAVWVMAALMILDESGVAIGPLLAAAGIAGLAFGFGGQYLIRDVISGLFIIVENQYRVGDVVCFDGTCGLAENVSLRMTTLRDLDGTVHHVPHGAIQRVSNLTKGYARVNLNVGIAYESDLEEVERVVNEVGKALAADPEWKDAVVSPPRFLRVDDFADSAIVIKILGDTKPIKQWDVAGELRKRLKIAFDKHGIVIPYPQRVIHHPPDA
jgi:small-conductance mechanosensitive channel